MYKKIMLYTAILLGVIFISSGTDENLLTKNNAAKGSGVFSNGYSGTSAASVPITQQQAVDWIRNYAEQNNISNAVKYYNTDSAKDIRIKYFEVDSSVINLVKNFPNQIKGFRCYLAKKTDTTQQYTVVLVPMDKDYKNITEHDNANNRDTLKWAFDWHKPGPPSTAQIISSSYKYADTLGGAVQ